MKITRRTLLGTIAAGFAADSHLPAFAEGEWPSRTVRLVSPYGAGGASDISLRILAEQFGRSLNQQFIVENKPGAGTRIANDLVAHAPGDGYTILYVAAIGGSGAARVVANNIHPMKVSQPEAIDDLCVKLEDVLKGSPPPWLRKVLAKGQERSFDFED